MLPAVLLCLVVGITDGDTLKARCDDQTLSVRLAEVDAPEKGQAFGNRSRQALAALCFRRSAQLRPVSIDRYGRTVAHVECAGTDAGTAQVEAGMAWVFVRYAPAGSDLYRVEREARAGRMGLWSDPHAVAPWIWREMKRS
jgi:endonuclease YncB( thermonuclease family)